jgi:hypothetical protein
MRADMQNHQNQLGSFIGWKELGARTTSCPKMMAVFERAVGNQTSVEDALQKMYLGANVHRYVAYQEGYITSAVDDSLSSSFQYSASDLQKFREVVHLSPRRKELERQKSGATKAQTALRILSSIAQRFSR